MRIGLNEAASFLKDCDDIVILTHQSPDGDCIGAGFALKDILDSFGKRCRIICSDPFTKRYDFMTETGCGEEFEPQTVVAVDIADNQLMGNLREVYGDRVQLCIDHHVSNTGYAERTFLDAKASATCEIIYELAKEMNVQISRHCAACIYTGIATDTGCFKYDCTTARSHEITAELMRQFDINYALINRNMFDVKSVGRMKMESRAVELMETFCGGKLTMICITAEAMEKLGVDGNDLEGCANLPLQAEGVEVGIMMKEREKDVYKISMRSAGDINVSEICQTLGGGGHAKAAGCLLKGSVEDVKAQLIEAVGRVLGE